MRKRIFVLSKAPRPLPQSWSSPSPPNHSTLQRHPAMAPWCHVQCAKVVRRPPPTIAHYNGTLRWHPAMAPRPPWCHVQCAKVVRRPPPTIAHYNGTLRWHPAMAPRPPWCHVQCAKVVRRPPPLLEVRTPIAIAIWGKTQNTAGSSKPSGSNRAHRLIQSKRP